MEELDKKMDINPDSESKFEKSDEHEIYLVHSPGAGITFFSATPYRWIPIAASNFDAQFPPQRKGTRALTMLN
ncbi:hypothetical protein TNCV_3314351 [Trichonephila clavipes]|nr:hypothetical protein TNCV_3314351 [Trichonephila clavipes]